MTKKRTINLIGWIFMIFLTIINLFYKEAFSVITTGFGGLVCIIVMLALVFYNPKPKDIDL